MIILCFSLIKETLKFAVPPEVKLLNFKGGENTIPWILPKLEFSRLI
jgi:hypothetical protein